MPCSLVRCLSALVAVGLAACTSASQELAIRDVTVIPGNGSGPLSAGTVVISGNRIVEVGPSADVNVPRGARVIDGSGKFLMPGLWEMHAHLSKTRVSALAIFLANGVTSVRDMGGDHEELLRWRNEVRTGSRLGPRIMLAGPYLESRSNVERMRNTPVDEMVEPVERTRIPVATPEDAERIVDSLALLELEYLKIRTVSSRASYRALAERAMRHGLDLVGHTFGIPIEEVIAARQRGIEHFLFPTLDSLTVEERKAKFRQLAENDVGVVPTLVVWTASTFAPDTVVRSVLDDSLGLVEPRRRYLSRFLVTDWREQMLERDPTNLQFFRPLYQSNLRNLREMREVGVRIMPGSDVAVLMIFPGSSLHDELALFVRELGMSPSQVIESGTRLPAGFLGLQDSLGTIEPGMIADLVLLDANPLDDISNTKRINSVIVGGRLFDRRALDSLLAEVESAEDRRVNDWRREKD